MPELPDGAVGPGPRGGSLADLRCASADGQRWFLVGASPDLRSQIESFPPLRGEGSVRGSAVEGILLAGADLDHVLGLFVLREASRLRIVATTAVRRSVCEGLRLEEASPGTADWSGSSLRIG